MTSQQYTTRKEATKQLCKEGFAPERVGTGYMTGKFEQWRRDNVLANMTAVGNEVIVTRMEKR